VLVDVSIWDSKGQVMGGLKASDFVVLDQKEEQKVVYCSRDEMPLNVVLLVDLSLSMKPFMQKVRESASIALAALKAEDQVALITFDARITPRIPLTADKKAIADEIASFRTGEGTNINDAVYYSAKYLSQAASQGRRVILLVSDNVPTVVFHERSQEVVDTLLETDVVLYSAKLPGENPVSASSPFFVDVKELARTTGGEIFEANHERTLDSAMQSWVERMKTRYTIGYYPTSQESGGKFHKIDVHLTAAFGRNGRNYVLRARRGYFPPKSPSQEAPPH